MPLPTLAPQKATIPTRRRRASSISGSRKAPTLRAEDIFGKKQRSTSRPNQFTGGSRKTVRGQGGVHGWKPTKTKQQMRRSLVS